MTLEEYFSFFKTKKNTIAGILKNSAYNHPNRIAKIATSGAISYTIDERDFASPGTSANLYEFDIDYSLANEWTRVFEPFYPWNGGSPTALNQGEFLPAHAPATMFQFQTSYGTTPSSVIGGSVTRTPYTRATTSDPWTAGTPVTTDLDLQLTFTITGGGNTISGGYDTDNSARALITFFEAVSGTHASKLPSMGALIYRFPWDTWTSETAEFATIFADAITAANAADGGGHSGTCSLSLDFS